MKVLDAILILVMPVSLLAQHSVKLDWTPGVGSVSTNVFKDGAILTSVPNVTPTYTDTTVVAGSQHQYGVQALALDGSVSAIVGTALLQIPGGTPPLPSILIDSGGPLDTSFSSGSYVYTTTHAITGTMNETLYKTVRASVFSYNITVPAGTYNVTLKFAEIYYTASGKRKFNVVLNGNTVLPNFDIFSSAGAAYKAVDKVFQVTTTGNPIVIAFTKVTDDPMINGIQVDLVSAPPPPHGDITTTCDTVDPTTVACKVTGLVSKDAWKVDATVKTADGQTLGSGKAGTIP